MTQDTTAPAFAPAFERDDQVQVEHETGLYAAKVLMVRPDKDGRQIVQVQTDPEGLLLTVYSEHCTKVAA